MYSLAVAVFTMLAVPPANADVPQAHMESPIAQLMESLYSEARTRTIAVTSEEFGDLVHQYAPALLEAVGGDCSAIGPALVDYMVEAYPKAGEDVIRLTMILQTPRIIYHFPCDTTVKLKSVLPILASEDELLDRAGEILLLHYDLQMGKLYVPDYSVYEPYLASVPETDPGARKLAARMMRVSNVGNDLLQGLTMLVDLWVTDEAAKAEWRKILASLTFLRRNDQGARLGPPPTMEEFSALTPMLDGLSRRPEWWARLAAIDLMGKYNFWRSDERFARLMADEDPIVRKNAAELKYEIDFPKPPDYSVYPPEESRRLYRRLVESGMYTVEQLRHYGIEIEESDESIPDDNQKNEDSAQPQSNG